VVTDFDGTATTADMGDSILLRFNGASAQEIEKSCESGVDIEKWMRERFGALKVTMLELMRFARDTAVMREGFSDVYRACRDTKRPFEIASGGLDIYIVPIVESWGVFDINTACGFARVSERGFNVSYPFMGMSVEKYKAHRVNILKSAGYRVVYCGDGLSDLEAARAADVVFATGKLHSACAKSKIKTRELDFHKVAALVRRS
jgi:2-hydroxy-3-keto-5-methylthiopentenyl-1-phosphate phosphatase